MKHFIKHSLAVLLISAVCSLFCLPAQAADITTQPLLQKADVQYIGAFRLPQGPLPGTSYSFGYADSGLAYYPAHNSLFINDHIYDQRTAEISIPAIVNSSDLNSLNTATLLQNPVDITEGNLNNIGPGGTFHEDGSGNEMGGLMVYNDKLIGTSYGVYDGGGTAALSHFTSGLTLSTPGDFRGMYAVGTMNSGFYSGYMTTIPQEWQAALGGPALTGQCCVSVSARSSFGPAAFVFNPDDLGVKTPVPVTPVFYYDEPHQTLGLWTNPQISLIYNMLTVADKGIAFPAGSRSVLFFGRQGTGVPCYGVNTPDPAMTFKPVPPDNIQVYCYDPYYMETGPHSVANSDGSSTYKRWVWAYDANDLVSVKNGLKQPWDIAPYAVWELASPWAGDSIQGVGYDPTTQRLYVSMTFVDGKQPVIAVYQINLTGTPPPPPPSTLPTPILDLPAFVPVNGSISASYPSGYVNIQFNWTITRKPDASNTHNLNSSSAITSKASSASIKTPSQVAGLGSLGLVPGLYTIQVQAVGADGSLSAWSAAQDITLVQADFSQLRIFPNPWRNDKNSSQPFVIFDRLPLGSTIKIFTLSGRFVATVPFTSDPRTAHWLLTNDAGDKVASGVYIYLINTDGGQKKTGQLVVIK